MDPSTIPDGDMASALRRPIFCPLCGSAHRFRDIIGEEVFILGRLKDLQSGYRCLTEDANLLHTRNSNCDQGTQAQHRYESPEIPLSNPLDVLAYVAEHHRFYSTQGCQATQAECGDTPDDYDAHPAEATIQEQNSPNPSEATTIRLDDLIGNTVPRQNSPNLTEASMEHLDEFSSLPIPPENSPGLSAASMEHLDEFSTFPISQEDQIQDQPLAHNSPSPTETSLELLGDFRVLRNPNQYRRHSMPAEGSIRARIGLNYDTVVPPTRHSTASLPAGHNCWDENQLRAFCEDFPSYADIVGSVGPIRASIENDGDDGDDGDNASINSDRTVTPSVVRNRTTDPAEVPRVDSPRAVSPEAIAQAEAAALRARFSSIIEAAIAQEVAGSHGDGRD